MLIVLSPAKRFHPTPSQPVDGITAPAYSHKSALLLEQLQAMNKGQIKRLMGLSDALAELNHQRFAQFSDPAKGAGWPCALAFDGETYRGLGMGAMDEAGQAYTQKHVRILSGLYGLLRPLDAIEPYRLEMGTRFAGRHGRDLYAFWRETITGALAEELNGHDTQVLVNLASHEYFKAIDDKALGQRVITPIFKMRKGSQMRTVGFVGKTLRGKMARFAALRRLEDPEALKDFAEDGYEFAAADSSEESWVFVRCA